MSTDLKLNIILLLYLIFVFKFKNLKAFTFFNKYQSLLFCHKSLVGFVSLFSIFHFANALVGIKWDEHYIALGGYYISTGLIPHVDFYIPNGAPIYYLQSLGNYLFSDLGLAYAFSAYLISTSAYVYCILKLKKHFGFNFIELTYLSFVFLICCSFWGGALWYNQLAFLCCSIAILTQLQNTLLQKELRLINLLTVSVLFTLAILTKPDIALIFLTFLILFQHFSKHSNKVILYILVLISLKLLIYYLYYQTVHGINVLSMMNFAQKGFETRIHFDLESLQKIIYNIFISFDNIGVRVICFSHIFLFFLNTNKKDTNFNILFTSQIFFLISSSIISVSSGRGAGFINGHLTFISAVFFLAALKQSSLKTSTFIIPVIITPLLLIFCLHFRSAFIPKFKLVKHANMIYYSSERSLEFFNKVEELIQLSSQKVSLYSPITYFSMNDKISELRPSPFLWDHLGTTIKQTYSEKHYNYFAAHLPDIFITNSFKSYPVNYSNLNSFGLHKASIEDLLATKYRLTHSGNIDLIGSGGGLKTHQAQIYVLKYKTPLKK